MKPEKEVVVAKKRDERDGIRSYIGGPEGSLHEASVWPDSVHPPSIFCQRSDAEPPKGTARVAARAAEFSCAQKYSRDLV